MRLDIDRWSASSTVIELIPCGRVRPTAAYFRAGHLVLDLLTRSLLQYLPTADARDTASQPHVPVTITVGSGTYQITVEDGIILTAPRTTSRDIKRHKASRYPDRGGHDGQC